MAEMKSYSLFFIVAILIVGVVFAASSSSGFIANTTANGTQGFIPRFVNETFLNNSVIFQKDGNIGIGSLDPQTKLEVFGLTQSSTIRATTHAEISTLYPVAFDPEEYMSITGYTFIRANQSLILSAEDIGGGLDATHMLDVRGNANFSINISAFNIFTDAVKSCSTELETDSSGRIFCGTSTGGGDGGNITINGTATWIPKITNGTNLGNSFIFQNTSRLEFLHNIRLSANAGQKSISIVNASLGVGGDEFVIYGAAGGDDDGGGFTGNGGAIRILAQMGGMETTSVSSGTGGLIQFKSGQGGPSSTGGGSAAGTGGFLNISSGDGGVGHVANSVSPGQSGNLEISTGNSNQAGVGNIPAGSISIYTGAVKNTGAHGDIRIGLTGNNVARGRVFFNNINVSTWINATKINVTQTANFFRNISIANVLPNGQRSRAGITVYNETNQTVCWTTQNMALVVLPGACGG